MVCSRCKKRMAVVFITKVEGDKTQNEGLCLSCAAELGIKPVTDMIQTMGISQDDIDNAESEVNNALMGMETPEEEEDGFEAGGTQQAFPFLQNLFGGGNGPLSPQGDSQTKRDTQKAEREAREKRKYLDAYCINLTQRAKDGKLDRIVGREKELYRVIQILNRRTKNNPCLIGEPGVGKTAIAEGLAQKIVYGDVPAKLSKKEVYLLDLTALVAGTQFRGQFESRIKGLIDEVKKLGNIILVIDEAHNLVGAGDAEGSMNAANILKPALSRGEIQVIGATTFTEYRKYIEKDAALERRFQPVTVEEPSVENSVEILKGIKSYYEKYHGLLIDDETVRQAVMLSERYITDRYLPDKAIDLIDEAASSVNIDDRVTNELIRKRDRLGEVYTELNRVLAERPDDYESIARLKGNICIVEDGIALLEKERKPLKVSIENLAKVIELWTGIPASKIKEQEFVKLLNLEDTIKTRIVGQDDAVHAIVSAIKRNRAGISAKRKPVSFIFAGPTGVGKTELVKQLAGCLFDSPETYIRLDMSEFMEKHSVSRIIGSPPGYVGYDEAGQLTEKVRRKPYSVILFDEIEKAHPDVLNVLLQILDDGRISDAHGKVVSFENTVIVMTTNAGSEKREGQIGFSGHELKAAQSKTLKALEGIMRPEFINRIDEIITFHGLTKEDFRKIAEIMLSELKASLQQKNITLQWNDEVKEHLVTRSFSEKYGARNLRRTIEKEVEDRIAGLLISGYDRDIRAIALTVADGEIMAAAL